MFSQGLPYWLLITGRNDASRFNKWYLYRNFSDDRETDGDIAALDRFTYLSSPSKTEKPWFWALAFILKAN